MGKQWKQWEILFSWAPKSLWVLTAAINWKTLAPWKKRHDKPRKHVKNQGHYFADKGLYSQSYRFSSSHVQTWDLDHKKGWALKKHQKIDAFKLWCWRRLWRVPWTVKEIKPVNPKGNQPWIFIGRTTAEAEAPILWPLMQKASSLEKTLMLGKSEGRRRRGRQRKRWLDRTID